MSRATGSASGAAAEELRTAAALDDCPSTAEAAAAGHVSLTQAALITRTAAEVPGSGANYTELRLIPVVT